MLRVMRNRISRINSVQYLLLLFCAVFLIVAGAGNTLSYVIMKTPMIVNRFLNGMNPDGDLVLQKTVSHPYGDLYTIPSDLVFTFEVNLGAEYANELIDTTQGEKVVNENGIATVTIAPGGRTTIYDIDEGTPVTVTEIAVGTGFTPDAITKELTIQKYQENILNFHNQYVSQEADTAALKVSGSKKLVGREWIEGDRFAFVLEVKENGEWKSLGTQTTVYELVEQADPTDPKKTIRVAKTDFDLFDFTELIQGYHFANAGVYAFRVIETEGSIGGLTYDKTECKFDILVGDADMDGYLEIQSITTTSENTIVNGTTVQIEFENSYAPTGSSEAFIEIQKLMDDNSGQNKATAGYTFELYDTEDNLLLTSEATDAAGETYIRLVYEPTDAGKTFEYVLKESRCGEKVGALTYDDATYSLKVTIVDNLDGTVSAYVYDGGLGWNITDNSSNKSDTVSGGDAACGMNVSGGDAGSDINVSGGDATATAKRVSVPTGVTNTIQKRFTNQYDPADASVVISGKKTLSGRGMNPEEFTFQMYQTDAAFVIPEGEQPVRTVRNGTDENFAFEVIAYNKVGTSYYVVKENTSSELGGITYDGSLYLVKVVVTDTEGVLNAAVFITDEYGKESEILFQNSYKASPVYLPFSGRKDFSGAALQEGAFQFLIHEADESFIPQGSAVQTVTNKATGEIPFDVLSFEKAGTYRYVITEQDGIVEGMTYDSAKYCITVHVTDSGDGQLVISEYSITKDGISASEILFTNTYKEPERTDEPDNPDEPDKPDEPIMPDNPAELEKPTVTEQLLPPRTGDDSNALLYSILMIVSGCMLLILLIIGRNRDA